MALDMDNVKQTATAVAEAEGKKIVGSAANLYRTLQRVDDFANGDPEVVAARVKKANDILRGIAPAGETALDQITVDAALAALPSDRVRAVTKAALGNDNVSVEAINDMTRYAQQRYQVEQQQNNGNVVDVAAVPQLRTAADAVSTAAAAVEDGTDISPLAKLADAITAAVGQVSASKFGGGKKDDAIIAIKAAFDTLDPKLGVLLQAAHDVKNVAHSAPTLPVPAVQPPPTLPMLGAATP